MDAQDFPLFISACVYFVYTSIFRVQRSGITKVSLFDFRQVMKELIDTEHDYVNDLNNVVEVRKMIFITNRNSSNAVASILYIFFAITKVAMYQEFSNI